MIDFRLCLVLLLKSTYDRVLVTGGAGFIGSHIIDALLNEGASVWALDDLSTGSLHNLRPWKGSRRLHFRRGSTLQARVVDALTRRVDAVIHLAAVVSPYVSLKKPTVVKSVNVRGTMNVLDAALKAKSKRVVFASSSSVYGNQTALPIAEDNPLRPITPYGASKLEGEKRCEVYFRTYGLSTVALRYFNVYGPRQRANPYSGVIAIFSQQLRKGRRPTIYGDGGQTRDFIHVSDVVTANMQALQTRKRIEGTFNVGTGHPTTINQLASLIATLVGRPDIPPTHSQARTGDIRDSYASVIKAKELLGFEAEVELKSGLNSLLESIS